MTQRRETRVKQPTSSPTCNQARRDTMPCRNHLPPPSAPPAQSTRSCHHRRLHGRRPERRRKAAEDCPAVTSNSGRQKHRHSSGIEQTGPQPQAAAEEQGQSFHWRGCCVWCWQRLKQRMWRNRTRAPLGCCC